MSDIGSGSGVVRAGRGAPPAFGGVQAKSSEAIRIVTADELVRSFQAVTPGEWIETAVLP